MADHPLRPATDHRLGRPLPHQLPNPTRAPPPAINLSPKVSPGAHAVLAEVSLGYPPQEGRFPRATHPSATPKRAETLMSVRLACVRHAASVRSEPGSNSQVHPGSTPQGSAQSGRPHPRASITHASMCASHRRHPRRRPRIPSTFSTLSINSPPKHTSLRGAALVGPPHTACRVG